MTDPRMYILAMLMQDGWQHKPRPKMHFCMTRGNETIELLLKGSMFPFMRRTTRAVDGTFRLLYNGGVMETLPISTHRSRDISLEDGWRVMGEGCRSMAGVMVQIHLHRDAEHNPGGKPYNMWAMTSSMPPLLAQMVWEWLNEDEEEGSTGALIDQLQDLRAMQEAQARS